MQGIIKKSTGSWYEVLDNEGRVHAARIKGKFRLHGQKNTNPIAVGDKVEWQVDNLTGDAVIEKLLPRRNYIIRKSINLSRQEHVIAANVDLVLILATLILPRTSQGFIDRILVTAEAYSIPALLAFNKADLYTSDLLKDAGELSALYTSLGYDCVLLSVKKGLNLDLLKEKLEGKTSLLTGHSGVGKSSLLNRVEPGLKLKTGEISGSSLKGKHTTTFAEMHVLNDQTFIVDTPGIKEFGLIDMKKEEISHYFPEMRSRLGQCRFSNCLHINEPGCAVMEALEEGEIHPGRYNSYLSMVEGGETHR